MKPILTSEELRRLAKLPLGFSENEGATDAEIQQARAQVNANRYAVREALEWCADYVEATVRRDEVWDKLDAIAKKLLDVSERIEAKSLPDDCQ